MTKKISQTILSVGLAVVILSTALFCAALTGHFTERVFRELEAGAELGGHRGGARGGRRPAGARGPRPPPAVPGCAAFFRRGLAGSGRPRRSCPPGAPPGAPYATWRTWTPPTV